MVEIYNSELLKEAGLVAICDDNSVTERSSEKTNAQMWNIRT